MEKIDCIVFRGLLKNFVQNTYNLLFFMLYWFIYYVKKLVIKELNIFFGLDDKYYLRYYLGRDYYRKQVFIKKEGRVYGFYYLIMEQSLF